MNILFVLEHFYPDKGGVERLFLNLALQLVKQQYQVTVVTTRTDSKQPRIENYHGIQIVRLPFKNRYLFTFCSLPFIIKYALRADLIHTTSYNAALPAWIAALLTRKKCVITFHEVWDELWWRLPYYNAVYKALFFFFEKVILMLPFAHYIAVSEATKNALVQSGIASKQITRIYNGVDYSLFHAYKHENPVGKTICYFGRLGASKGLDQLLNALATVTDRFRLLLIIPSNPAFILKNIQRKLSDLKLVDKTIIKHDLTDEDLFSQISKSSFVVIPSLSEGFCFNAVECAAMEIPVIASYNTALKETVSGKHIFITGDNIAMALKEAFLDHWSYKETLHFDIEDTVVAYAKLYDRMLL